MGGFMVDGCGAADSYYPMLPAGEFYCPVCRKNKSFSVMEAKRKVRVFYIPTIPLYSKYVVSCSKCKNGYYIDEAQKNDLLAGRAYVRSVTTDGVDVQPLAQSGTSVQPFMQYAPSAQSSAQDAPGAQPFAFTANVQPLAQSGTSVQPFMQYAPSAQSSAQDAPGAQSSAFTANVQPSEQRESAAQTTPTDVMSASNSIFITDFPAETKPVSPARTETAAAAASNTNFCMHCGAPVKPDNTFCVNCGTRVR